MTTPAEILGLAPRTPLLIIHCDDLGLTRSTNEGVYEALRGGVATSASLMVPAPWGRDAAALYEGEDVGVQLTANAESDTYRWGPVTVAPSLLDGNGGFPQTLTDLWEHADLDEVGREARAQLERAIVWGFDVSHLSSHMWAFALRPEFFDVAVELAVEYKLPMRLPSAALEAQAGFPFRRLAAEEGIVLADHVVDGTQGFAAAIDALCQAPQPGVTDLMVRPAPATPELHAACRDADERAAQLAALLDRSVIDRLEAAGIVRTDYRTLRAAQRS